MRAMTRWGRLALVAPLVGVLAVGTGAQAADSARQAPAKRAHPAATVNVTIAVAAPAAAFSLLQIAKDRGLFPPGVNVSWQILSGANLVAPLATGAIPLALSANGAVEIGVSSSGAPVKWLASWSDPSDFQLVARPGISSVADLKGKAVAITTPSATTAILTNEAMHAGGLGPGDFTALAVGSLQNQVAAFAGNRVSAILEPSTTANQILQQIPGSTIVYDFYAHKFPWTAAGLVGYMPWVQKHPTTVIGIITALNKALKLVHTSPNLVKPSIGTFTGTTGADIDIQYNALAKKTNATLLPMTTKTLVNVLTVLRQNGIPDAKSSLAATLTTSAYVNRVVPPTATTKK